MIISHKYKFIFFKTYKTAGTSLEVYLSQKCGESDIVTPIYPPVPNHVPRNFKGAWNIVSELSNNGWVNTRPILGDFLRRRKFYNHVTARVVKNRVPGQIWSEYFKFCVERNPWDKTLSHYHMIKDRKGGDLTLEEYFELGHFCVNSHIYTDRQDKIIVDQVVKYEHLLDELSQIFNTLRVPFSGTLGVREKSEHRKDRTRYQDIFSNGQRAKIEQVFQKEIVLHGYKF